MLNIDSSGMSAGKVSHNHLVRRWAPVGVFSEDIQEANRLGFEAGTSYPFRVPLGLLGEDQPPTHQPGPSSPPPPGGASPSPAGPLPPVPLGDEDRRIPLAYDLDRLVRFLHFVNQIIQASSGL